MLTPPSAHRQAVLRHAAERDKEKALASERREERLAEKLEQERGKVLAAKREQIRLAKLERESYLASVRSLFNMSPQKAAKPQGPSHPPPLPLGPAARPQRPCAPLSLAPTSSRSEQCSAPPSSKSARPTWSEVSTAAPSSVGYDDDMPDFLSHCGGMDGQMSPATSVVPASSRRGRLSQSPARILDLPPTLPEASETIQSLNLEVGQQLRKSIEQWLKAQETEDPGWAAGEEQEVSEPPQPLSIERGRGTAQQVAAPSLVPTRSAPSLAERQGPRSVAVRHPLEKGPSCEAARPVFHPHQPKSHPEAPRIEPPTPAPAKGPPGKVPSSSALPPGSSAPLACQPPGSSLFAPCSSALAACQPPGSSAHLRPSQPPSRPTSRQLSSQPSDGEPERQPPPEKCRPAAGVPVVAAPGSARPRSRPAKPNRAPPQSLRALQVEEEDLMKSLLKLDFAEMRRQFSGKAPLWKKEALDESFKANSFLSRTLKEQQLEASLERIEGLLEQLRKRDEARAKVEEERKQNQTQASSKGSSRTGSQDIAITGQSESNPSRPTDLASKALPAKRPRSAYGLRNRPSPHPPVTLVAPGRSEQDGNTVKAPADKAAGPPAGGPQGRVASCGIMPCQRRAVKSAGPRRPSVDPR